MIRKPFHFKQFKIYHDRCSMKVGTDGVLLGAWAKLEGAQSMLDIGTGTGLIAIMTAQKANNKLSIDAVEIDENAYTQALENVNNCQWTDWIQVHHSSIQDYSTTSIKKYDLIISNPPFFLAGTQSNKIERNTARHTNLLTFDDLIKSVLNLLSDKGKFSLILPIDEGGVFIRSAQKYRLYCTRLTKVRPKQGKPFERLLIELSRQLKSIDVNELTIQFEKRNDYTPEYIALTREFYTIM